MIFHFGYVYTIQCGNIYANESQHLFFFFGFCSFHYDRQWWSRMLARVQLFYTEIWAFFHSHSAIHYGSLVVCCFFFSLSAVLFSARALCTRNRKKLYFSFLWRAKWTVFFFGKEAALTRDICFSFSASLFFLSLCASFRKKYWLECLSSLQTFYSNKTHWIFLVILAFLRIHKWIHKQNEFSEWKSRVFRSGKFSTLFLRSAMFYRVQMRFFLPFIAEILLLCLL